MKKHLETFKNFIKPLGTDNVVIGGTFALKAHGLIMSREASDLDLIIFKPTDKQKEYIKQMKFFQQEFLLQDENCPLNGSNSKQRSFKFKKNGLIIDVLFQDNIDLPTDLLLYNFNDIYYKVQSIKNTIDAKRSYSFAYSLLSNTSARYVREKDIKDFNDLKNSNFNL